MLPPGISDKTIATISDEFWNGMMGIVLHPDAAMGESDSEPEGISGHIELHGAWKGSVEIRTSRALARETASRLIGKGVEEISVEECFDAVQEATNIIAGSVKRLMPPICKMNVPSMSGCSHLVVPQSGNSRSLQCRFAAEALKLVVIIRSTP